MTSFPTFLRDNAPFLAAGMILTFGSSFGQTFFISVFAGEIRAAFDLSHGDWGLIYSTATLGSAALMIWAGTLTDVLRVRVLGPLVLGVLALACLGIASVRSVASLTVAVFLLRLAGQGMATLVATVAMARWFTATRGRALSVAATGVEIGQAVLPVIFVAGLAIFDWRMLWVGAALVLAVLVPTLWPLLRLERTPRAIAGDVQATGMGGLSWRRIDLVSHPLFWSLVPLLLATPAFSTAFFFHQVHFVETKGLAHLGFVALFPVFTIAAVMAIIVSGFLIDRIGTARLLPLALLPMAIGFVGLATLDGMIATAVGLALLGVTQGTMGTVPNAFWAEFYGTAHMGAIRSLAAALMVFGTAIGPVLTGRLIDAGMPFADQLLWIAAYFAAASAIAAVAIYRVRAALARAA